MTSDEELARENKYLNIQLTEQEPLYVCRMQEMILIYKTMLRLLLNKFLNYTL